MFALKEYQQRALDALSRYFRVCSETGDADTAFYQVTKELLGRGIPYNPIGILPDAPYICLRMPTGAGKTFVAAHAVGIATKDLLHADRGLVLWLVPTTQIRDQTLDALRDHRHPYRQAVEAAVGAVEVLDVAEALYLNRSALETSTVILVATMQSFRVEDTEGRKVYSDDGSLMDHFSGVPEEALAGLERREDGSLLHSLANVLRLRRPVVMVDEAHNARTELAFEMLARFDPSCIIELTATPDREENPSNVLHSVSAAELKAEEMIKLPIELTTKSAWRELLSDAIAERDHLHEVARAERSETGEYIRPIMLLQAEPNYRDRDSLSVEVVREALRKDFNIPVEEIAVATGASNDLEGVDLLSPECPIRYVITVQKLKEGWDCPFAYVLCSVTALRSSTAIEQITGRILRMPGAKRKGHEELNRAYAFAASEHFGEALNALKDVLVENGFERQEVETLVQQASSNRDESPPSFGPLFEGEYPPHIAVKLTVQEVPQLNALPDETQKKTRFDAKTGTLEFRGQMTEGDRDALKQVYRSPAAQDAVDEAFRQLEARSGGRIRAPVERGERLEVPRLLIRHGDIFEPFEKTHILERPWKLSGCLATLPAFELPADSGRHGMIDVTERGILETRFVDALHHQMTLLADEHGWTVARLVSWQDRSFPHPDIPPAQTGIYLTRLVQHLIEERGIPLDALVHHKYPLRKAVAERVEEHRQSAHEKAFQAVLGLEGGEPSLTVQPDVAFSFPAEYPYSTLYQGAYLFTKHFYAVVGAFDSDEEEQCAQFLDQLPQVEYWVRNLDRRPNHSFWLQTSSDRFYPDFVCKLRDGRTLVVEYKGAHLWSNTESTEKRNLGELWAERSGGTCRFVMIKEKNFAAITAAIA